MMMMDIMENEDDTATSIHPILDIRCIKFYFFTYTALRYILFKMWSQKAAGTSIDHIAQMAHETLQKDVTYMSINQSCPHRL